MRYPFRQRDTETQGWIPEAGGSERFGVLRGERIGPGAALAERRRPCQRDVQTRTKTIPQPKIEARGVRHDRNFSSLGIG